MRDIELYEAILGLTPPWKVIHVELDVADMEVTVKVDAGPSRWWTQAGWTTSW